MERLRPGRGDPGPGYWDRQAERYVGTVGIARDDHPFVRRIRSLADADTTVVDVGAGSGRVALAVAPYVRRVVAVDQSRGMLDLLDAAANQRGIANVETVHGRWEEVEDVWADVAVCSYVLPKVADVVPFVRRLDATAGRHALVEMGALDGGWQLDPLWRHFHGTPRAPQPTYLDALDVLAEVGIDADAEVAPLPATGGFADVATAASHYRGVLLLGEAHVDELRELLAGWLQRRDDGWWPPVAGRPTAVLSWAPRAAGPPGGSEG